MVKLIKNIGEILVNDITLTDTRIGLYIPLKNETENVTRLRKQLEQWLINETRLLQREIYFKIGEMKTAPCLYINIGQDKKGEFEVGYSVVYLGMVENEEGEEVVYDITDPSPIELSEEERGYINNLIMNKLQKVIFGEG